MNRGAILVLKNYFFVSAFYADGAGAHRMPRRIARLRRPRPLPPPPFVCSVICANRWTRVLIHSLCSSLDDFSFGFSIFSTFFFKKIISSSSLEHPLLHLHPLPHSTAGRRPIPTQEKKKQKRNAGHFHVVLRLPLFSPLPFYFICWTCVSPLRQFRLGPNPTNKKTLEILLALRKTR